MYFKHGFYEEQSPEKDRVFISDERFKELFDGQAQGKEIYEDAAGYPQLRDHVATQLEQLRKELDELEDWFDNIYDMQVKQIARCERLGIPYDNKYGTPEELDQEAVEKAARIKELRTLIGEISQ